MAPRFNDAAGCEAVKSLLITKFGNSRVAGAGTVFYAGSIARMTAELDLGRGDYVAAVKGFGEGLAVDAKLGARPFLARGHLGLARALGATGDLAGAVNYARMAAVDARTLDMPGLLAEAGAFLADAAVEAR